MLIMKLFNLIQRRMLYGLIFLLCFSALGYAMYSQYFNHVEPCPLCIAQRIIYLAIAIPALIGFIHKPSSLANLIYAIIILAIAIFGIKTAAHHIWLQNLPPEDWPASCGMPLDVLYQKIPLTGFIHTILSGSTECAMVNWRIFGISGTILSLTGYILSALGAIALLIPRKNSIN